MDIEIEWSSPGSPENSSRNLSSLLRPDRSRLLRPLLASLRQSFFRNCRSHIDKCDNDH